MAGGIAARKRARRNPADANEEQSHGDQIAARMCNDGDEPNFIPEGLASAVMPRPICGSVVKRRNLIDMIGKTGAGHRHRQLSRNGHYVGRPRPTR